MLTIFQKFFLITELGLRFPFIRVLLFDRILRERGMYFRRDIFMFFCQNVLQI